MELTRRRVLAGLATGAAGAGGYYLTRDSDWNCTPIREPNWEVDGERWSRPVVGPHGVLAAEGFTATGGNWLNRVGSFDHDDPRWVYAVDGNGIGVPFADEDLVAVGDGGDRVHAFDQPTGHHRWTYDAGGREEYGGGSWGQPVHVDGAVVTAVSHSEQADPDPSNREAYTHRLLALDDEDGSVRWACPIDGEAYTGPVVYEDVVVVATEAGGVFGVALDGGEALWRDSLSGEVWAPLCLDEGRGVVYAATTDGDVAGFDAATGERAWTRSFDASIGAATRTSDRLIVGTRDDRLLGLHGDGETAWETGVRGPVDGLDAAAGRVVAVDETGIAHVLSDEGGVRSRFRVVDGSGDQCGWRAGADYVGGVHAGEFDVTVSARWWVREFDLDE